MEGSSSDDFQVQVCLLARVMSTMFMERHFAVDSFIHSRRIVADAEIIETKKSPNLKKWSQGEETLCVEHILYVKEMQCALQDTNTTERFTTLKSLE